MMWLKLLAPLTVLVIGVLGFYLANKWRDRRTTKNRIAQRAMLAVLVVSTIATAAIVIFDGFENRRLLDKIGGLESATLESEEAAQRRESAAQKERLELKNELRDLEEAVKPVAELAGAKYPNLDLASAVSRLVRDVEDLDVRLQTEVGRIRDLSLDARIHFRGEWEGGRPTEHNWAMWGALDYANLELTIGTGETKTVGLAAVGPPLVRVGDAGGFVEYTLEVRTGDWPLGQQLSGVSELLRGWVLVVMLKREWFSEKGARVVQLDLTIRSNGVERATLDIPMDVEVHFEGRQRLEWQRRQKVSLAD